MYAYYRSFIIILSLIFLTSCQTPLNPTNNSFFSTQSTDASITTAVLESMLLNENTSTLNIHVETTNGVVVLSGYVKTIRQSDTSEEIARKTAGVKTVQNNIIVRK